MVGKELRREVCRDPDHRPHGQVDVARDDHQRLTRGDESRDGDGQQEAADEARTQVVVDDEDQHDDRDTEHDKEREQLDRLRTEAAAARSRRRDGRLLGAHVRSLGADERLAHATPTAAIMIRSCSRSSPSKMPI